MFDLTDYFKQVFIESREKSFIPDILLQANNQEKIFFEVVVTHASSVDKVDSGYRIIECLITCEKDIEIIESCLLEESEAIQFINFKHDLEESCRGECYKSYDKIIPYDKRLASYWGFIIYKNGKSLLFKAKTLDEIDDYKKRQLLHFEYISHKQIDLWSFGELYRNKVVETYEKGLRIKNCFLCRYHAINRYSSEEGAIFCKFLKKCVKSNEAANCQYLRPDSKVFSQYKKLF